jgi:hypothetical protein
MESHKFDTRIRLEGREIRGIGIKIERKKEISGKVKR